MWKYNINSLKCLKNCLFSIIKQGFHLEYIVLFFWLTFFVWILWRYITTVFVFQGFPGFGDGGLHMPFGIGAFPFGLFTSSFTLGDNRPSAGKAELKFNTCVQNTCSLMPTNTLLMILWVSDSPSYQLSLNL